MVRIDEDDSFSRGILATYSVWRTSCARRDYHRRAGLLLHSEAASHPSGQAGRSRGREGEMKMAPGRKPCQC